MVVWPADLHVIGPDIVRFHAALWPAMLMAAGLAVPAWCVVARLGEPLRCALLEDGRRQG